MIGEITREERVRFEQFLSRRPNFGAGLRTLIAAAIWQHFEDCFDKHVDERLRAARWLRDEGQAFWNYCGLPAEQFGRACDHVMPASLRQLPDGAIDTELHNLARQSAAAAIADFRQELQKNPPHAKVKKPSRNSAKPSLLAHAAPVSAPDSTPICC